MHIFMADGNYNDSDRFYNVMRLALPGSECYVCPSPLSLRDFFEAFAFDFAFIGSFGELMSLEEFTALIKQLKTNNRSVHCEESFSDDEIHKLKTV